MNIYTWPQNFFSSSPTIIFPNNFVVLKRWKKKEDLGAFFVSVLLRLGKKKSLMRAVSRLFCYTWVGPLWSFAAHLSFSVISFQGEDSRHFGCLSTHTAITWECSRLCCCVCTCKNKKKPHHTSKRAKRNKKLAGSVMADMAAKATVRHSCVYTPTFVRQWPHSRWPYPVFRWMRSSTRSSDRRPFWWRVNQSWLTSWEWFVIFEPFK